MRRALAVMLSLLVFLPVSGCTLSVYNNYRELERLQVIETVGLDAGGGGGVGGALAAHACLFRAWGAAPNASGVGCWYRGRRAVVFGAVGLALFVPFADALGVLVPQLFCLPVLAVRLALEKKEP